MKCKRLINDDSQERERRQLSQEQRSRLNSIEWIAWALSAHLLTSSYPENGLYGNVPSEARLGQNLQQKCAIQVPFVDS